MYSDDRLWAPTETVPLHSYNRPKRSLFLFVHCWGDGTPDPGLKGYRTSQGLHLWSALLLAENVSTCLLSTCISIPKYELAAVGAPSRDDFQCFHFPAAINHLAFPEPQFRQSRTHQKHASHFKVFKDESIGKDIEKTRVSIHDQNHPKLLAWSILAGSLPAVR